MNRALSSMNNAALARACARTDEPDYSAEYAEEYTLELIANEAEMIWRKPAQLHRAAERYGVDITRRLCVLLVPMMKDLPEDEAQDTPTDALVRELRKCLASNVQMYAEKRVDDDRTSPGEP